MAEAAARYIVQFEQGFPRADIEALGAELVAAGVLAPGFIPPSAGLLRLEAIVYAKEVQGYDTVILPDRNLVSRMARVARDGHAELRDNVASTIAEARAEAWLESEWGKRMPELSEQVYPQQGGFSLIMLWAGPLRRKRHLSRQRRMIVARPLCRELNQACGVERLRLRRAPHQHIAKLGHMLAWKNDFRKLWKTADGGAP
jgi:hypothetical protein